MSETASYIVPGMHCGHCKQAVSEELAAVEGALTSGDEADGHEKTEELLAAVQRFARRR